MARLDRAPVHVLEGRVELAEGESFAKDVDGQRVELDEPRGPRSLPRRAVARAGEPLAEYAFPVSRQGSVDGLPGPVRPARRIRYPVCGLKPRPIRELRRALSRSLPDPARGRKYANDFPYSLANR